VTRAAPRVTPPHSRRVSRPRPVYQDAKADARAPLRIGVMLRGVGEYDGAGVYIRSLLEALLRLDRSNRYVFFYSRAGDLGRFAQYSNVRETVVRAPGKLLWDQVAVPLAARRAAVDVLFHHKFSVPVLAPCPTIVQQRGTEYWTFPEYYPGWSGWVNRRYNTLTIPIYCRRAARVLTNSDSLAGELTRLAGVPPAKMATVYAAADERFRRITDQVQLAAVRERYGLPDRPFFLMVVKGYARVGESARKLCSRKNLEVALAAYARLRQLQPNAPPMVILGAGVKGRLTPELLHEWFGLDPESVVIPGLIGHDDMPAAYSLAGALLFPSYYESFGIPLVEAMACGCPVITSSAPACPEVVGDAALIVHPDDQDGMTHAMLRLIREPELVDELRARGLERARHFSWDRSARQLLAELERVGRASPATAGRASSA